MRHSFALSKYGIKLRPVCIEDADFICQLRNEPSLSRYINATSEAVSDQMSWLERYFDRPDDYYFCIEAGGRLAGTIGLYDVSASDGAGEWGRWLIQPGVLAAPASCLLIYEFGFRELALERVYCRTVAENLQVVSFHDRYARQVERQPQAVKIANKVHDFVVHEVKRDNWHEAKAQLEKGAILAERLLR